jgi:hypothetical protein
MLGWLGRRTAGALLPKQKPEGVRHTDPDAVESVAFTRVARATALTAAAERYDRWVASGEWLFAGEGENISPSAVMKHRDEALYLEAEARRLGVRDSGMVNLLLHAVGVCNEYLAQVS